MKTCIALLMFLTGWLVSSVCIADADYWSISTGDKAFFQEIKKAVLAQDFDWFADAVDYPIELHLVSRDHVQPRTVRIRTRKQLNKYKSAIFNEDLRNAVRNQSADSLFKNWQGLMIGNGELWFDQRQIDGQTNWTYRITAINLPIQNRARE